MLLLKSPGGKTLSSSIDFTLEMNTGISGSPKSWHPGVQIRHSPDLEDDSDAVELPGSSGLQYKVLVYG